MKNFVQNTLAYMGLLMAFFCCVIPTPCRSSAAATGDASDLDFLHNRIEPGDTVEKLQHAIESSPTALGPYVKLSLILVLNDAAPKEVLDICLKGLRWYPESCVLTRRAMRAYFQQGDIDEGLACYRLLSKMDCMSFSLSRKVVTQIARDMERDQFIEFSKRWLALNPVDRTLNKYVAKTYMRQREWQLAQGHLETIFENHENVEAELLVDMGTCKYNLGKYKEALELMERARDLGDPVPEEFFAILKEKISHDRSTEK